MSDYKHKMSLMKKYLINFTSIIERVLS